MTHCLVCCLINNCCCYVIVRLQSTVTNLLHDRVYFTLGKLYAVEENSVIYCRLLFDNDALFQMLTDRIKQFLPC